MTIPENLKIPRQTTLDKYGITQEEWLSILEKQDYVCPICKKFPSSGRLYIEHEHISGWKKLLPNERKKFIRGACCFICNYRILTKGVTAEKLLNAANYLKEYQNRKEEQ